MIRCTECGFLNHERTCNCEECGLPLTYGRGPVRLTATHASAGVVVPLNAETHSHDSASAVARAQSSAFNSDTRARATAVSRLRIASSEQLRALQSGELRAFELSHTARRTAARARVQPAVSESTMRSAVGEVWSSIAEPVTHTLDVATDAADASMSIDNCASAHTHAAPSIAANLSALAAETVVPAPGGGTAPESAALTDADTVSYMSRHSTKPAEPDATIADSHALGNPLPAATPSADSAEPDATVPDSSSLDAKPAADTTLEPELGTEPDADAESRSRGAELADVCHIIVFALISPIAYLTGESALLVCVALGLALAVVARTARRRGTADVAVLTQRAAQALCWWCMIMCAICLLAPLLLGGQMITPPAQTIIYTPPSAQSLPTAAPTSVPLYSAWLH